MDNRHGDDWDKLRWAPCQFIMTLLLLEDMDTWFGILQHVVKCILKHLFEGMEFEQQRRNVPWL